MDIPLHIFNVILIGAGGLLGLGILCVVLLAACTEPPDMDIVACEKCGDLYYGKDIKNKRCIKCS